MAVATAQQLRNRNKVLVTLSDDLQVECKRPDPIDVIASQMLPLELYADVLVLVASTTSANLSTAITDYPMEFSELIDRWVCAVAVAPRIVLEKDDATDDAVWVEDLLPQDRGAIWRATNDRVLRSRRVSDMAQTFREERTLRARVGSSSVSVPRAPEPSTASDGSDAGAGRGSGD